MEGPQTVWRPDWQPQAGNRPRWPTHRLRRGRYLEPPWPQVTVVRDLRLQVAAPQPKWRAALADGKWRPGPPQR